MHTVKDMDSWLEADGAIPGGGVYGTDTPGAVICLPPGKDNGLQAGLAAHGGSVDGGLPLGGIILPGEAVT